ncbi:hypothetical protein HYALB_00000229 [Hymenoscyphus albidus]|uniref:Rhodopsin domain-containing protein n=1 Tax=Hymenoscyphus albidus TaxID=595503 RepID=A0A9N9LSK3_9HELO|nr:hypothetical protein HYALB_00000229 [Hymenoscyphus albidus]
MALPTYQDRNGLIALSTVLPVLSTEIIGLRFWVRLKKRATLEFDDWVQFPSLLLYAIQHIQILALTLIKLSALAFYRRIFCAVKPSPLNYIIWTLIGLCVAWAIAFVSFYAASCGSHPQATWQGIFPFIQYCLVLSEKFEESFAISDFILDTLVLVVPLPSIWSLKITQGRKIGLTGVFMLALIGYGASTARLVIFVRLANAFRRTAAPDIQLQDSEAVWFSMLETGFALIAVNLPSLWGLISQFSPESIIRSVRSLISLRSNLSSHHSTRGGVGDPLSYTRKNSSSASQNIELVSPNDIADFSITAERARAQNHDHDLESGIQVQQSVQILSQERIKSVKGRDIPSK